MKIKLLLVVILLFPLLGLSQGLKTATFNKILLSHTADQVDEPQQKSFLSPDKPQLIPSAKKNIGKAMLMSLVFPGAGEYYMGHHTMGKFLMGVDLGLWTAYWGSTHLEGNKIDDYRNLARQHAEVGNGKYNSTFWIQVGNHMNVYVNNEQELIERNLDGVFTDTDRYYWSWDNADNLNRYNQLRIDANNMQKFSDKMVMGLFINRLISVVNVLRIHKMNQSNNPSEHSMNWNLDYHYSPVSGDCMVLSMVKTF